MRVSSNMMPYNFLVSLHKSLGLQNKLNEQLSDGKAIHRPSDDPVKTIRSLRFSINLTENDQYTQNVKDATSWMETTDGSMSDLSSLMIQAKGLAVSADAAESTDGYKAMAAELDNLINHAVTIGNAQIGDRYIFAGQNDKVLPFERKTINGKDVVVYTGDNNKISMPIKPGDVTPSQDSVNLSGEQVFGPATDLVSGGVTYKTMDVFTHLIALKEELEKNPPDRAVIDTALDNFDKDHSRILCAQTELGARMSSYELATNLLDKNNEIITKNLSLNTDLDVAKAIVDYKSAENVYKASLSVGSRLMPISLVDFLD